MGKTLQSAIYSYKALFLTALLFAFPAVLFSQIAITDADRFNLSFTTSQTTSAQQSLTISLTDLDIVAGEAFQFEVVESSDSNLEELTRYPGVRNLRSPELPSDTFLEIPFRNTTSVEFQRIMAAFDFLYDSGFNESTVLQLFVRVEDNLPKPVQGARIVTDNLQFSDPGWNTFSLQFTIDEIYLKRNASIDFIWKIEEYTTDEGDIPLAIQQIELMPERSSIEVPESGSLVITEVLASNADEQSREFIELYNQTENAIPLKGLEVITSAGSFVVQSELFIEPYGFAVLSNNDFEGIPEQPVFYQYNQSVLPAGNGFIEMFMRSEDVAASRYSIDDPNRSVEINRSINGSDGFTAAQQYSPAESELESQLFATPGIAGSTRLAYTRQIASNGYSVISVPGLLQNTRDNVQNLQFFSSDGEVLTDDQISPFRAVVVRSDQNGSNRMRRLVAEDSPRVISEGNVFEIGSGTSLLSLPTHKRVNLSQVSTVSGEPAPPVALLWNSDIQNFRLINDPLEDLDPWSSIIVNSDADDPLVIRDNENARAGNVILERFIGFRLFEEVSNRREQLVDETLMGFIRNERGQRATRYDLPVFLPFFNDEYDDRSLTVMHMSNPESNIRANKFSHLPFELDREYTFTLGVSSTVNSVSGVLDWSQMEDIPDEWVLTIEDRLTGLSVDMREETRMRFRHAVRSPISFDDYDENSFNAVRPSGEDRFAVTLKPYQSVIETEEEDTRPGSVELRQNYPNPFNPATTIVYYLPEETQVRIGVYNVVGQPVGVLVDENMGAGEHTVTWNAADLPSGIYIVQLETGNRIFTRKITLIK